MYVLFGVEVVLLAVIVVLARLVGKHATHRTRTTALSVAFAVAAGATTAVFGVASIYYRIPIAWMAAIAVGALTALGLFYAAGRDASWKTAPVIGLVGLLFLGSLAAATVAMAGVGEDWMRGRYTIRATQIGEELGFAPLLPSGHDLPTDQLPVNELDGPDAGISFTYSGFELHERKADSIPTAEALRALVEPGSTPMLNIEIPDDATYEELEVDGKPAVAVQYSALPGGESVKSPKADWATILVTVVDGVDVRIWSAGREQLVEGEWQQYGAYTPEELVEIAESLGPIE